jgi:N-acetylmuramic acid 6-phosphate etherase
MTKITESDSLYNHLEKMTVRQLLLHINQEDHTVPSCIKKIIPAIEKTVRIIVEKLNKKGRLFYIGAGTSGRLGIVDASECPPTYGIPQGVVIGLIAGGDAAIRKAVEFAEDDTQQGWLDLKQHAISKKDMVIGITASGTTPYVLGALKECNKRGITTACITHNPASPVSKIAKHAMVAITGPEFVTGSTRMKAGTAQKLILNMISSATMIQLGRVRGNKMIDMQLSNTKLVDRGTKMVMNELGLSYPIAQQLLLKHGNVRSAIRSSSIQSRITGVRKSSSNENGVNT